MVVHTTVVEYIPIGQAVLQKVVDRTGGIGPASARLGLSTTLIAKFLDGTIFVPDTVLLRAVDVVLDEQPSIPTDSQPFQRIRP